MTFRHRDGTRVHLAYCTNVHPAEDAEGLHRQLRVFGAGVRARLDADRIGLGLWLPAPLAARLATEPAELDRLRRALDEHGIEVVTLNAFPYRGFHAPVVKKAVYRPDWTEEERLGYTLDCARVLTGLLPDDAARGSVSTVPLAWREPWDAGRHGAARAMLDRLAEGLAKLEAETGRTVRVGLEPEPGCIVETVAEAVELLAGVDTRRIGVCLDTCHLAVAFEDPAGAVAALAEAGLPVVKAQVSAALHAAEPADADTRAALARYTEDRFLHQVRELPPGDGAVAARDDLPQALEGPAALPGSGPWRVHFHAPLHQRPEPPLDTTSDHLERTLAELFAGPEPRTDHLEVETYTWSVLPERFRPTGDAELAAGLAAELRWAAGALGRAGLTETEKETA
ncbi:metabolite traffic protein EboE [Streptomyces millisiae]|uniref:Metabolite traffic protein EboE n=1 Tax=Streptomyces millisiae TaxID=3075542 RepID=A0ABU2LNS6_9ACTN|nr:metabolite traffic protein EboE [Streptomyces sp. DSM 44918]MDT0319239.1 metabolite traffic protein EboE [Streptomyces sp. DSM 44918]